MAFYGVLVLLQLISSYPGLSEHGKWSELEAEVNAKADTPGRWHQMGTRWIVHKLLHVALFVFFRLHS